jgi:hypothetical protein
MTGFPWTPVAVVVYILTSRIIRSLNEHWTEVWRYEFPVGIEGGGGGGSVSGLSSLACWSNVSRPLSLTAFYNILEFLLPRSSDQTTYLYAMTIALPYFPALLLEFIRFLLRVLCAFLGSSRDCYGRFKIAFEPGVKAWVVLELERRACFGKAMRHYYFAQFKEIWVQSTVGGSFGCLASGRK